MSSLARRLLLAAVLVCSGVVTLAGCGGSFHSTDSVVSVSADEVCVERQADPPARACFDPARVGGDDEFGVGDCVEIKHAGESARVLSVRRVSCEGSTTSAA